MIVSNTINFILNLADFDKEKILLAVSILLLVCQGTEYWVRPNTNVDCPLGVPTESCVTLSDIAANNSCYFVSNTQINFLSGIHFITSDTGVWIGIDWPVPTGMEQIHNLSLVGEQTGDVVIHCRGTQVGFSFLKVENLTISRLSITRSKNIENVLL